MSKKTRKRVESRLRVLFPLVVYPQFVNTFRFFMRRSPRIQSTEYGQVFETYDVRADLSFVSTRNIFCRRDRNRGSTRWVPFEVNSRTRTYGSNKIPLTGDEVFLDCGANVGELGIWTRHHGLLYVAFEPAPQEAVCCDLDNFDGKYKSVRKALGSQSSKLQFYQKSENFDNSLIDMGNSVETLEDSAARLDDVLDASCLGAGIGSFKVEAEGAEIEVLQGASSVLRHFDCVFIDNGSERGVSQDNALAESASVLQRYGHCSMLNINQHRLTATFNDRERCQSGTNISNNAKTDVDMELGIVRTVPKCVDKRLRYSHCLMLNILHLVAALSTYPTPNAGRWMSLIVEYGWARLCEQ